MIALARTAVAKRTRGRPSNEEGGAETRLIRAFPDIAEMLAWIVRIEGGTTANLIDPMLRAQVTARYERHRETVERIKKAEAEVQRIEAEEAERIKSEDEPPPRKGRKR